MLSWLSITQIDSAVSSPAAKAFLCSSPVTAPAFSLPRSGKCVAGHFRCPMDRHRPCFSSRGVLFPPTSSCPLLRYANAAPVFPGCHAVCTYSTGRAAGGVTARAFPACGSPALQSVTSFALFVCFRVRRTAGSRAWAMSPTRSIIAVPQIKESMRMLAALQSPGSRRGVAPHRLCAPLPPRYPPARPRGCNRPSGPRSAAAPSAINTRARPPPRGSLPASGSRLTTASRRQARPSGKRYFQFARNPAAVAALRLPGHGLFCGRLRDR